MGFFFFFCRLILHGLLKKLNLFSVVQFQGQFSPFWPCFTGIALWFKLVSGANLANFKYNK